MPQCGKVRAALELQSCSDADRPRGTKRKKDEPCCSEIKNLTGSGEHLLPSLKPIEGTELRLTKFPEKNYPDGSSPAEITQHSLDLTYVFETLLSQYSKYVNLFIYLFYILKFLGLLK